MHDIKEQQAIGREARKNLPRSALADWTPPAGRDVIAISLEAERGRIPELLPLRRKRMAASPFEFFRGSAALMARDLATRPNSGLLVQICGDAHVNNLGAYASPEGHLVFDINDFDETTRAPFEWDLLRFAASLVLAGQTARDSIDRCASAVAAYVRSYRKSIESFSKLPFTELLRVDIKRIVTAQPIDVILRKAERATPATSLKQLTVRKGSHRQFRHEPPLLRRVDGGERDAVIASLDAYGQRLPSDRRFALAHYQPIDVAFKVVGTGSIGVHDYVILFAGVSDADVLFLQVKQEMPSCYAPFVPQNIAHDGERVVDGQRLMQRTSDPFLGWTQIEGNNYLVRQLNDHKAGVEPEELKGKSLVRYARVAGIVHARAHARSGDAAALAAYCGFGDKLDRALTKFALAYAKQTIADHRRVAGWAYSEETGLRLPSFSSASASPRAASQSRT